MWKIAIVDDDPNVLQGMRRIIPWGELDLEWVGEGRNGQQGLDLIRGAQPDIVITDIYMPVMNGLDMIGLLREEGFQGKIAILSGYSDFEYARQAVRLAVDDYVSKPVSVKTLRQVIENMIGKLESEWVAKENTEFLHKKLLRYEQIAAKEWMKSIVEGTFADHSHHERFIGLQPDHWLDGMHLVIGCEISSRQRKTAITAADWNLFRFAVSNVVNEIIFKEGVQAEYIELQTRTAACVVHFSRDCNHEHALLLAQKLSGDILDSVKQYLDLDMKVGIGSVKEQWRHICDSATEAFVAIAAQSEGFHTELNMTQLKFYHHFAQAIRNCQPVYAHELVDGYIAHLCECDLISPALLNQYMTELWTIIAYSLFETGSIVDDAYPRRGIQIELIKVSTIEQFGPWLHDTVDLTVGSRNYRDNIKHRKAMDTIVAYIHEHYREEITLEEISDIVDISRNYLCQIFKKATGETFNQYLTRVRMEKAKELMMEGKWMIYEIADKVGYKNVPYFSSLFKKLTGLAPTDFVKQ